MLAPQKRDDHGPTFHDDGTVSYLDPLRRERQWQRRKPRHIPQRIRDEWGIALPGQPVGEEVAA